MTTLLTATDLARTFVIGSEEVHAVHDVNIEIYSGRLLAITGRSGSGKTTSLASMLNVINETRDCHIITLSDLTF